MSDKDNQQEVEILVNELRIVMSQLVRRLRQETPAEGLSWMQASIITRLDQSEGLTSAELARTEGVRPQSMSSIVAALEAEGFIQRTPDPEDGRRILLSLTEKGRKARTANQVIKQQWMASRLLELSIEELNEVRRGIELLKRVSQE